MGGILLAALLAPPAAHGGEEPVARHVLALVPGKTPDPHTEDRVHELLETPLNYLGMVVRRHYVGNGPPPAAALDDARAVLTYFGAQDPPVEWLWPWLEDEVGRRRLRVVHFGDFGPLAADPARLGRWLRRFGLVHDDAYYGNPFGVELTRFDPRTCAFEADPRAMLVHRGPRSEDPTHRVWIETRHRTGTRTPVVTGDFGGVALDPWTLRPGSDDQDRRWHLDPFLFFREALGLERVPAPHPSVLNGRRLWMCQVDGDGFESLTTIQRGVYAAEAMHEEIFLRYRLPYTVSIIVRSLTKDYRVEEPTRAMRAARAILNQPHVEPASHGVLHTLKWQVDWAPHFKDRVIMWYRELKNYEYSQVNEVADSIRFIEERLLDEGRRCEVMLWTGFANPREDAIRASRESGSLNLNGGVFRWDQWYDSVGFVTPWSRRVGAELQVYAGAANENDFEGFFDTMPGAFFHIDQTIERTGSPRILKPANLYIHFYSAESPARLESVHRLIQRWAFDEETAPVFCSTYCRAVRSAVDTARIARTPDGWALRGFGDCRTARIDDEPRGVDFSRSRGLLGARRRGDSLYLHLAGGDADVVLANHPPRRPHVESANCLLEKATLGEIGVEATAVAHNRREVLFAGFEPDTPVVVLVGNVERRGRADERGRVSVRLPEPGRTRLLVRDAR